MVDEEAVDIACVKEDEGVVSCEVSGKENPAVLPYSRRQNGRTRRLPC